VTLTLRSSSSTYVNTAFHIYCFEHCALHRICTYLQLSVVFNVPLMTVEWVNRTMPLISFKVEYAFICHCVDKVSRAVSTWPLWPLRIRQAAVKIQTSVVLNDLQSQGSCAPNFAPAPLHLPQPAFAATGSGPETGRQAQ